MLTVQSLLTGSGYRPIITTSILRSAQYKPSGVDIKQMPDILYGNQWDCFMQDYTTPQLNVWACPSGNKRLVFVYESDTSIVFATTDVELVRGYKRVLTSPQTLTETCGDVASSVASGYVSCLL